MPDVNVLIYAHRVEEASHPAALAWLEETVNGDAPVALSALVIAGFTRIVTNPRLYREPTPTTVALATVESMLARPNCQLCLPGPRHWELFNRLCRATNATGKLVADAQHAALAIEHGGQWFSRDDDFTRFEAHGLRWTRFDPKVP